MTLPALIERRTVLTLGALLTTAFPATRVVLDGQPLPALETSEEWVVYQTLAFDPLPVPPASWVGTVTWQVTCWSRIGIGRADNDSERPWTLAATARNAFRGRFVSILSYDQVTPAPIAVLSCGEASETYLAGDEPAVHGVALRFSGVLSAR